MSSTTANSAKLFQPIKIGRSALQHRVVMAPLTRFRANDAHVPLSNVAEHYSQRASTKGTLLITEATVISPQAGGYSNVPGIWSDEQISEWKKTVNTVHDAGSFVYLQLWSLGRAADPAQLASEDSSFAYISASPVKLTGKTSTPRAMTIPEIQEHVQLFATAASNAVHKAGFDGVEIHGANGYIVDQFIQDVSNNREDRYGGSIEGRARFALEVLDAVVKAVGADRAAIRLSPWSKFQDMGMEDPVPQFSHIVECIHAQHPSLSYIHLVTPRVHGWEDRDPISTGHSNDFVREMAKGIPIITAGGYTAQSGLAEAEKNDDLIAYGRAFIANPDLPMRIKNGTPLTKGDRATYYAPGSLDPKGYTDYPFASQEVEVQSHL